MFLDYYPAYCVEKPPRFPKMKLLQDPSLSGPGYLTFHKLPQGLRSKSRSLEARESLAFKEDRIYYADQERTLTDSELKTPLGNFKNVPYHLDGEGNLIFGVLGRKNCFEI